MIIVTGGAGFIGSNLVTALEKNSQERIVICDFLGRDEKWRNIAKRCLYDIIPPEALPSFLETHANQISIIFHLGAITSFFEDDLETLLKNNIRFSLDLFHWCGRNRVRFIYASSASTYGNGESDFDDASSVQALSRLRPLSPYGWSKHTFDKAVALTYERFCKEVPTPPQCVGLKFFNVYGPNEYHKENSMGIIPTFVRQALDDGQISLFASKRKNIEDGGQMRDFVYVKDCVDVMMWFMNNPDKIGLFNVGTGKARRFDDLAKVIFKILGKKPKISFHKMPDALEKQYQYYTQATLYNLRSIGYDAPFTPMEEGVSDYINAYLLKADSYV